ncbi:alpha/beta fold hydrolase [Wenzhouxiangella sp. AB-CW3]|uniref:alpha/beta fold hydrolase n=1 Tax=Wenzhouxiangella sp. AB-CW3 TaxID=2771012 RepID=UPI00168AE84B|nr:alpha/beta fold hydrolase [Wenzhouxiangella sp. AB-CW3]QOC23329.1 alpha/beta fold hydrolase [Wenzhouxiangella sp. AB-CW3]
MPVVPEKLFPFERHFHVQSQGHRMHYVDEGPVDGQPVVMVHGNPTWSFYYRRLIAELSDAYRCLAPDHVGMGLSDRADEAEYEYTMASRVADLGHFIDAVEPERPVDLVVHDWGGAIAMAWAVRHPERVRRIVLLNTWAFTIPSDMPLPAALKFARTGVGGFLINRFNAFSGLAARLGSAGKLDREVAQGLTAPYRNGPRSRLATLRFVQDIPLRESDRAWSVLAETEAGLQKLADKPIRFIWGRKDFVFDDRALTRWQEIWPDADYHVLEGAAHYVIEDAPQRVLSGVREHLQ